MRRMCSTRSSSVSTWPYIIVAVVDMPSRCACRITLSHSELFVFFGAITSRTRSTSTSPPPPGTESRPASRSRERVSQVVRLRAPRDVLDLRRRQRVQVDRVALLDRAEEILVVVDPEVGMVAALHEEAGAAERERLLDLLEDDRLRQQVALVAVARAAVEGAEVAVGDADVRVVQVPVDDERDAVRVGLAAAQLVRDAADRDEVARVEERDRLVVGDALAGERLVEDLGDGRPRVMPRPAPAATKRSSGTWSSSPTSRAISRNVYRPARSRGPNE